MIYYELGYVINFIQGYIGGSIMAKKSSKKIKIPKSVLDLQMSPKKFAKRHNIRLKGKGMSKRERKYNTKRLRKQYAECAATGLNKAVKILAEHDSESGKKILKVKRGVDNIISNPDVMKRIAKIYKKNPDNFQNMIYLPYMIINTLAYYNSDAISEEEKEIGKSLDTESLVAFCEKILKREIKRYKDMGLDDDVAFMMASAIPTTKMFKINRQWYNRLIKQMYEIAFKTDVDIDAVLKAVRKVDKKKQISKKEFLEGFFSEFIMQRSSNKNAKFTDTQKELHEGLIERCLVYLDNIKTRKLREILKQYIKRRKTAESYKNDGKRVIKFIDHANSNSPYTNIKSVVQDLINDNSSNELYLS